LNVDSVATATDSAILYEFLTGGLYSFIVIDMVYSQICDWLSDFIDGAAPSELVDKWDCDQWIVESEVIEMFTEFVLPTFKKEKTRVDAETILRALLWEYYLFRRDTALAEASYHKGIRARLLAASTDSNPSILNASEFSGILIDGVRRNSILRRSARYSPIHCSKTDDYASVIRQIYEGVTKSKVHSDVGTVCRRELAGLSAVVDGVVDKGCLMGFQGGISDDEYYCQMQVQMEVCDVDVTEICKCKIKFGSAETVDVSGARYSGAIIAEPGEDAIYSPLFTNDATGLKTWLLSATGTVKVWTAEELEITTMMRNRRWWNAVGLPAYRRFTTDFYHVASDPMFMAPTPINFGGSNPPSRNSSNSDLTSYDNDRIALFIDEDELYK